MKPTIRIVHARTPDGQEMVLFQHDRDFGIRLGGQELMNSRRHESEQELARLGCLHLAGQESARVLVGGLGLGYTLRQALDVLGPRATVVVSELMPAVVEWNRVFLGALAGHPLQDRRVELRMGDVVDLIRGSARAFDAILLDIDNGPDAMTTSGNGRLYGREGIAACCGALKERGCLAVWSAQPDKGYERNLMRAGMQVRLHRVPGHPGSKSASLFVWVAFKDQRPKMPKGPFQRGR